jgi:hypothetical protein
MEELEENSRIAYFLTLLSGNVALAKPINGPQSGNAPI